MKQTLYNVLYHARSCCCKSRRWRLEERVPRLVSIYSGFPRFPGLCHVRSAPARRLHNIVFISSCSARGIPPSSPYILWCAVPSVYDDPRLAFRHLESRFPFNSLRAYTRDVIQRESLNGVLLCMSQNPKWAIPVTRQISEMSVPFTLSSLFKTPTAPAICPSRDIGSRL